MKNVVIKSNSTPLIMSIKNGFADVALHLSQLPNSNPNHADKDGNTALSIASKQGYKEIVLNLLEKGAYLNTQNKVNLAQEDIGYNLYHKTIKKI